MFTFIPKSSDIANKNWLLVDVKDMVLGRAATKIASFLRGKHKPIMMPGSDCGDFVIVVNSDHIKLTGKKLDNKMFYWHTGYPGGIKSRNMRERLEMDSTEVIMTAVKRMLPKGPLSNRQLTRLRIFKDHNHTYDNHKPVTVNLTEANNERN